MKKEQKEWKWPLGIFIGYMIFVTGTLAFVIFTFTQHRNLVAEDYYEQTLEYDQHLEQVMMAKSLENPLEWSLKDGQISFEFPPELLDKNPEGEIRFFRPSDSRMDRGYDIALDDSGMQHIAASELRRGLWKVQVQWRAGEDDYYVESNLFLQ